MKQTATVLVPETGLIPRQRNYGIDLLRCFSMLLIVVTHIYNQAGVMNAVSAAYPRSVIYYANFTVRQISLTAVNLYALISGYVMFESSFKPRRLLSLWLQVVFIGVVLCAVGAICGTGSIGKIQWINAILPVTQKEYWYFSAYAGMFLLTPICNLGMRSLSQKGAVALAFGLFFFFSFGSMIGLPVARFSFGLEGGYSVLWLTVLYLIGACLKKTDFLHRVKNGSLLLVLVGCLFADILWKVLPFPSALKALKTQVTSYLNPFAVIFSVCLFALFSRMQVKHPAARKLIAFFAPMTFSVYLIHVHPLFWALLKNRFTFIAEFPKLLMIPAVLGTALGIYLLCSLLDWLRLRLFRLCRTEKFCLLAEEKLRKLWDRIYTGLFCPK